MFPVKRIVRNGDVDGADQIGDLLVERDVLAAAEHDDHVREPEQGLASESPKIAVSCLQVWAA